VSIACKARQFVLVGDFFGFIIVQIYPLQNLCMDFVAEHLCHYQLSQLAGMLFVHYSYMICRRVKRNLN